MIRFFKLPQPTILLIIPVIILAFRLFVAGEMTFEGAPAVGSVSWASGIAEGDPRGVDRP